MNNDAKLAIFNLVMAVWFAGWAVYLVFDQSYPAAFASSMVAAWAIVSAVLYFLASRV